jgi:hypothetical protein
MANTFAIAYRLVPVHAPFDHFFEPDPFFMIRNVSVLELAMGSSGVFIS